jgi:hypothetical protein
VRRNKRRHAECEDARSGYPPDVEPYISNSGDLTRDKIAKLVEMVMEDSSKR